MNKLAKLDLSPNIKKWIISFLSERSQVTKIGSVISGSCNINKGVVQGSGIGPTLYTIMAHDLRTISTLNLIFKYADDTNLLVPEHTDVELAREFDNVCQWAHSNKMILNRSKTKELVFHRPNPRTFLKPKPLDQIDQVNEAKLLGVIIKDSLKFDSHVKFIMSQCSQRTYLLKQLRDQGFASITIIFRAIIVSRLLYALPVWGGFLSQDCINQIDAFLRRSFRYKLCDMQFLFIALLDDSDHSLFKKMCQAEHCVFHLLPDVKTQTLHLRCKGHPFNLPPCPSNLHKKSFVTRCLFKFI